MDKATEAATLAIEGPHSPVPESSKFTLDELRSTRWNMLSNREKGFRRIQARAAIEAAAPIIRAEVEREIVEWLRKEEGHNRKVDVGGKMEAGAKAFAVACMVIANALENGDHRKRPMDLETARDRTWP